MFQVVFHFIKDSAKEGGIPLEKHVIVYCNNILSSDNYPIQFEDLVKKDQEQKEAEKKSSYEN